MISRVSHANIDFAKWNKTIAASHHAEIYAYSWFLDKVSPQWSGLILNDYEAVMPLPVKSKYGFSYIVQPPFCQKLGIFSTQILADDIIAAFEKKLFKYSSIRYCSYHRISEKYATERANYIIPLDRSVQHLQNAYNENTQRNIKKARNQHVTTTTIEADTFISFYESSLQYPLPESYKQGISGLLKTAETHKAVYCIGAYAEEELISAVAFFTSAQRSYYLMGASNEQGKECSAMFLIVDAYICMHANTNTILDFEGSEIAGVARFYQGFGAQYEPYYITERHAIPFLGMCMK